MGKPLITGTEKEARIKMAHDACKGLSDPFESFSAFMGVIYEKPFRILKGKVVPSFLPPTKRV